MSLSLDVESIAEALAEVLAYDGPGRSPVLESAAADVFPEEMSTPAGAAVVEAFEAFRTLRQAETRGAAPQPNVVRSEISRPRSLLLFDWELNVCDGVGEAESDGFVTEANFPPWDFWLGIVGTSNEMRLLSFVPAALAEAADRAVGVTAYDDLIWCDASCGRVLLKSPGEVWAR